MKTSTTYIARIPEALGSQVTYHVRPQQSDWPQEKKSSKLSLLDLLRPVFDQFVDRILAYNSTAHLGLIPIGPTACVSQPMTQVIESFRATVKSLSPSDDTALWDASALSPTTKSSSTHASIPKLRFESSAFQMAWIQSRRVTLATILASI